ncbi:MAG: class I SAM-dependent rRNA methyltransferase [Bacteroidales bacterium]|nr:class I SAM-dependent rRNA methyltransferase [Bacteroidales bacterium]
MSYPVIRLKRGKEGSVDRFHPWIFSGAIEPVKEPIEEGEIVTILSHDGRVIGTGHYQIGSIVVRVLDFSDTPIDAAFFRSRLEQALRLRQALGLIRPDNDTFRLVHGEGDYLPGLVVDIYGDTAVMQAHSPGMHFARDIIAQELVTLNISKNVYYKSETTLPYKAHLDPVNDYLIGGGNPGQNIALENGLRFHVDWLRGQKTGFFIDQRDNRELLRRYSRGRRVLNMFCYTGGFSVYALAGGAERVVSVDSSERAIQLTNENIELNAQCTVHNAQCTVHSAQLTENHSAEAIDAFKYLEKMEQGEFDLIVLDPPAFAKHRSAIPNATRGYQRLNAAAIAKIAPGGILFTFSCSQAISREQFRLAVFSAAAQTRRRVRILHQLTQPADHPINIYHPEGEYLKGLVLYVE